MLQKYLTALFACAILFVSVSMAQETPQWKVGDRIEILNLSKEWVPGTIIGTVDWNGKLLYRVKLDDDNAPNVYFNHTPPTDIRSRGGQAAAPVNGAPGGNDEQGAPAGGAFKVGDQVDTFYDPQHGHNRGTVIQMGDRKYKVHYTGCEPAFDEWVDASLVQAPATISSGAPQITYLFGRWRTTTVAVGGNYAVWGHSPGIEIKGDGTYTWKQYAGKPPVTGRWITDAKVPKQNEGTPKFDGLIVKDENGEPWKAFKWAVGNDNIDRIEIDKMCSGLSDVGSRVR